MFNKLNKMVMSLLLTAVLSLAFAGFGINTASAETGNEVKLLHASFIESQGIFKGSIEVENIAYHKIVNVVRRTGPNNPWVTIPATYAAPTEGNLEAWEWRVNTSESTPRGSYTPDTYEFYIEYLVDGKRYVDDNNGSFYRIGKQYKNVESYGMIAEPTGLPSAILNKPAVKLNYYCDYCGRSGIYHQGTIIVKNIAYHKDVKIVYTTDNWTTVKVASAQFNRTLPNTNGNLEEWLFQINMQFNFQFAIMYTVDGITYWDTNYNNRNYPYKNSTY